MALLPSLPPIAAVPFMFALPKSGCCLLPPPPPPECFAPPLEGEEDRDDADDDTDAEEEDPPRFGMLPADLRLFARA